MRRQMVCHPCRFFQTFFTCCAGEWFVIAVLKTTEVRKIHVTLCADERFVISVDHYNGRLCTKLLISFLAKDSVLAFVTDSGAEFHTCTDGNWKLFSLSLLLNPALSLILFELLVILVDGTFSNRSFKQ